MHAFPRAQKYLENSYNNEFKLIYGMEGYYLPSNEITDKNYNIHILVKNKIGLKNLYKIVSFSHLEYFNKTPQIPKNILDENREGLLIGSACSMGELYQAILENREEDKIEQIASYYDYLEIQPIENNCNLIKKGKVKDKKELQDINIKIVELGEKLNKIVVATSDIYYLNKEDKIFRDILKNVQSIENTDEQKSLYFRNTEEMLNEFKYLTKDKAIKTVVTNTNKIANMCEEIKPISDEKCYPYIENAKEDIKKLVYENAHKAYGNTLPTHIKERLEKELKSIIENDFSTLYYIAYRLVKKSNEDGYLVEMRGSSASSLVAYFLGITGVDPIKYNIPFETFAGFDGDKEPNFDFNFAEEYKEKGQEYVKEILNGVSTYKAGTVGTIASKTAHEYVHKYFINNVKELKKYYDYRNKKYKIDRLIQGIEETKRTTGQLPGGVIVVPQGREIYEFCPVQHPENNLNSSDITTHFDYHSIDKKLLKLDILGHTTPSILHKLQELTGLDPITINLEDTNTMEMICSANTTGIPEFGTDFVKRMILKTKPTTFEELLKISGLSHGSDVWLNNAEDLIESGTATLKEVIACKDDIMNDLIENGIEPKIAYEIMETVRQGRVKNGIETNWDKYKEIMKSHNVPDWYIKSCEKISYIFPKAHAVAYVIDAFRIAYYKAHYEEEFNKVLQEN